jgi:hypothetical protein
MKVNAQSTITVTICGEDSEELWRISAVLEFSTDGAPRIVELRVRSAEGSEIPPEVTRNIDFGVLAGALRGAISAMPDLPKAASPSRSSTRNTSRSNGRSGKSSSRGTDQRPYRRMPDVEEVKAVYLESGSVGKLALHYDVPRYTAQAWVDRLRRLGHVELV